MSDPILATGSLRRRLLARAMAAALALVMVAPLTTLGQEGDPIRIGGLFHLTGIGQIWGPLQQQPAILAVEEINEAGGVLGRPLELISEDDETDPDVSVQKGTKLALEDGVEAIFGLVYSSTRSAVAANVAERYQVPYFYPTYSEGGVCGRYFINLGALPNQQLDFFIPYLMERYGPKFYFVGQDYVWPQESIAYSTKLIEEAGGEVVGTEFVPIGGTSDWGPILGRIRDAAPDVYFPFIGGDDLISNLRQFYDFGLNEDIAIASTLLDESFIPAIPEENRGSIPTAASYFMALETPENQAFLEKFRARWGDDAIVTNIGEGTYNSIHLWAAAVEAAGAVDKEAMIDALPSVTFAAPQGEISIQEGSNHASLRSLIAETQPDGTFVVLEDFGLVEPLSNCEI
jgi:branched-chain amino acid transport system substrate-binding protein/urea transport system substrate-binding protein